MELERRRQKKQGVCPLTARGQKTCILQGCHVPSGTNDGSDRMPLTSVLHQRSFKVSMFALAAATTAAVVSELLVPSTRMISMSVRPINPRAARRDGTN